MSTQEVRPAAMRAFMTKYLPYIRKQYLDLAPVSYVNEQTIGDKWRTQSVYTKEIADALILKSKVFLSMAFPRTDQRHYDIELLGDLSDLIAGYLAPYARRSHAQYSRQQSFEDIKRIIFTDNEAIKYNIEKNAQLHEKYLARMAQREQEQAAQEVAPQRKKRARIQKYVDEHNNIHHAALVCIEREMVKRK